MGEISVIYFPLKSNNLNLWNIPDFLFNVVFFINHPTNRTLDLPIFSPFECVYREIFQFLPKLSGERYDFVIHANKNPGAYWIQLRGLGECGVRRVQQLAILRYARGPYQPSSQPPTYDFGIPQGVVSTIFDKKSCI